MKSLCYLAAVLLVMLTSCAHPRIAEIGGKAPNFNLQMAAGDKSLSLAEHHGPALVLNFWSASCHACVEELPDLNRIHNDNVAPVIGIALDQNSEAIKKVLEENGIEFDVAVGSQNLFEQYDGYGIPYTLILDRDKTIRKQFRGKVSYDEIAKSVRQIKQLEDAVAVNAGLTQ